jgi:hypothetical protein
LVPSLLLGQRTTAVAADLHIFSAIGPGRTLRVYLLTAVSAMLWPHTKASTAEILLSLASLAVILLSALDRASAAAVLFDRVLPIIILTTHGESCGFILCFVF